MRKRTKMILEQRNLTAAIIIIFRGAPDLEHLNQISPFQMDCSGGSLF